MEKKPKFTVLYEKLRGKSFEIDREIMSIGRTDSCDIQLPDGSVSSHHADIIRSTKEDGSVCYILRDNDSTNGTRINNEPISEQVLKNSDLISFGHVEVLFDGVSDDSEETHAPYTIDLGNAGTNTTSTKTFSNFSARMMNSRKKNAQTNKWLNIALITGGILVLGVVIHTLLTSFFHNK
jgi:pSer/pThr/pTyr-binding forkhead associated (FHA) protein